MSENNESSETRLQMDLVMPPCTDQCCDDYDCAELKLMVDSFSPRVSALLHSNEAALEHLLASERKEWQEECERFDQRFSRQYKSSKNHMTLESEPRQYLSEFDDDEDGLTIEWKKLLEAEQRLREELEASDLGWSFTERNDSESDDTEATRYPSEDVNGALKKNTTAHNALQHLDDFFIQTNPVNAIAKNEKDCFESVSSFQPLDAGTEAFDTPQFRSDDAGYPSIPLIDPTEVQRRYALLTNRNGNCESSQLSANIALHIDRRVQLAKSILSFTREYVIQLNRNELSAIFVGIDTDNRSVPSNTDEDGPDSSSIAYKRNKEELPIRSAVIRIRPDVLCGAVMDAVHACVQTFGGEIIKRQGGHLKALLPRFRIMCETDDKDTVVLETEKINSSKPRRKTGSFVSEKAHDGVLPSILLDIQLCSKKKARDFERTLLIRTYKVTSDADDIQIIESDTPCKCDIDESRLIEAAKLVQQSLSRKSNRLLGSRVFPIQSGKNINYGGLISPLRSLQNRAGIELCHGEHISLPVHTAPSTDAGFIISADSEKNRSDLIPALNSAHIPYIISSRCFLTSCLSELDNRGLSYCSLSFLSFAKFPALSTLCPHYCSQLKEICRISLVKTFLKSAKDLESFARESEYSTANMILVLRNKFKSYQVDEPPLPTSLPLTAFPLDFQPPEVACAPWGHAVEEALNQIPHISSGNSNLDNNPDIKDYMPEFQKAQEAVSLVSLAFQKQADDELSERLCRKNLQVIDRISKMQSYRIQLVSIIQNLYSTNESASQKADEFNAYARQADSRNKFLASDQVPLFECSVMMGSSYGTCLVTAYQLLIITKRLPVVGGKKIQLVTLADVEVNVTAPTSSVWNPLYVSAGIALFRSGSEEHLFSFKPSLPADRFKIFVDCLKDIWSDKLKGPIFTSYDSFPSPEKEHDSFLSGNRSSPQTNN